MGSLCIQSLLSRFNPSLPCCQRFLVLGSLEVEQSLVPKIDESDDNSFMEGLLHHTHCGLLRELMVYVKGPADAPRPVALGPSLIEGTCGRIKRIVQDQGSIRIRDCCIRAKALAKETHLRVDREPSVNSKKWRRRGKRETKKHVKES